MRRRKLRQRYVPRRRSRMFYRWCRRRRCWLPWFWDNQLFFELSCSSKINWKQGTVWNVWRTNTVTKETALVTFVAHNQRNSFGDLHDHDTFDDFLKINFVDSNACLAAKAMNNATRTNVRRVTRMDRDTHTVPPCRVRVVQSTK